MVNVTVRPVVPADGQFLMGVYASTRVDELAMVPWTDEEKQGLIRQQFGAQDVAYRANYPGGEF